VAASDSAFKKVLPLALPSTPSEGKLSFIETIDKENPLKKFHTLSLAASILLFSHASAFANDDQTLEPVFLANTDNPTEGAQQLPPYEPTQQAAPQVDPAPLATPSGNSNASGSTPQLSVATTKIGIPVDRVGSFVTVVTKDQIRQMQANTIVDVLKRVPGVDVAQNGGLGQTASIFIRGMNSEHTMVLVDGIEVNDPMSPNRAFNFPDMISLDSVDRIEVVRGPQSQLYGSDAIGGVINIITNTGSGRPTAYIRSQGGSYGTIQNDADLRGGLGSDKVGFTLHATQQRTAGFSISSNRYGNHERDPFHMTSLTGQTSYQPTKHFSLNFLSRYSDAKSSLDAQGGFNGDDPNYFLRQKMMLLGGRSRLTLMDGRFEQIVRLSSNAHWMRFANDYDQANQYSERAAYNSHLMKIDVQNNFQLNKMNKLMGGVEISNERGYLNDLFQSSFGPSGTQVTNRTATNVGLYFQDYIKLTDRWFTTAGVRWDEYNRFGHATTYRAATNYVIPETGTTFKASYGTGFKAPTLYQLYVSSPFVTGNTNLKAERSQGWDVGVEQKLFKNKFFIGATYYHNHVNNLINTITLPSFMSQYSNVGNARMEGGEVYSTYTPYRWLTLRSSYSATYARDLDNHEQLLRRPHNKYSFNVNIQPSEKWNLNLDITHVGNRIDDNFATFPATRVILNHYTMINLALSYKLSKNCTLFGRLVNLLDTPYEEIKGYGTPRISAYGGLQLGI